MSKAAEVIAKIEGLDVVESVNVWLGRRAYINLTAFDRSFAGCRNHQLYIDLATGELVDKIGKGTTPSQFDEQRRQVVEAAAAA